MVLFSCEAHRYSLPVNQLLARLYANASVTAQDLLASMFVAYDGYPGLDRGMPLGSEPPLVDLWDACDQRLDNCPRCYLPIFTLRGAAIRDGVVIACATCAASSAARSE